MARRTDTRRARPRTLTQPRGRSPAPDTSPPMAHSQVTGVPRPPVRFQDQVSSQARAVSPDLARQHLADQDPVDRHPADSGREDLRGPAGPPGPCQETALFPDTPRHLGTPPPEVSRGRAVTARPGSRARTAPRASQVLTACRGLQGRTRRRATKVSSVPKVSPGRTAPKVSLDPTAPKVSPARMAPKASLVSSARRASQAPTACKDRQAPMLRQASPGNSAGRDHQPPMTRSGRRGRTEGTATLASPAPAKVRQHRPATRRRTGSSAARWAMRAQSARAALPAPPVQSVDPPVQSVARPVLAVRPVLAAPELGTPTRGAGHRAGSPQPGRARTGTPTTGTRPPTGTARPSTAASTRM